MQCDLLFSFSLMLLWLWRLWHSEYATERKKKSLLRLMAFIVKPLSAIPTKSISCSNDALQLVR